MPPKKRKGITIRVIPDTKKKKIIKPSLIKKKNVIMKGVKSLNVKLTASSKGLPQKIGSGFPSCLRTLKKDVQFAKRQYPSLAIDVIEQVLIDTIPKEAHIPSTCADLERAMQILQEVNNTQIQERKGSLRH